jgi:hypothetical protein
MIRRNGVTGRRGRQAINLANSFVHVDRLKVNDLHFFNATVTTERKSINLDPFR